MLDSDVLETTERSASILTPEEVERVQGGSLLLKQNGTATELDLSQNPNWRSLASISPGAGNERRLTVQFNGPRNETWHISSKATNGIFYDQQAGMLTIQSPWMGKDGRNAWGGRGGNATMAIRVSPDMTTAERNVLAGILELAGGNDNLVITRQDNPVNFVLAAVGMGHIRQADASPTTTTASPPSAVPEATWGETYDPAAGQPTAENTPVDEQTAVTRQIEAQAARDHLVAGIADKTAVLVKPRGKTFLTTPGANAYLISGGESPQDPSAGIFMVIPGWNQARKPIVRVVEMNSGQVHDFDPTQVQTLPDWGTIRLLRNKLQLVANANLAVASTVIPPDQWIRLQAIYPLSDLQLPAAEVATAPPPTIREQARAEKQLQGRSGEGCTDPGVRPGPNEDFFATPYSIEGSFPEEFDWLTPEIITARGELYAVADGVGGKVGGEFGSPCVIKGLFHAYYSNLTPDRVMALRQAIEQAHQNLQQLRGDSRFASADTTLTAAVVERNAAGKTSQVTLGQVGDSRAYLTDSQGEARQLTTDHSWVAEQVLSGLLRPQEAAVHPQRNVITRSMGDTTLTPDIITPDPTEISGGKILVLATDGLTDTGLVSPLDITNIIRDSRSVVEAAQGLVSLAKQRNSQDNITAVVIRL